METTEQIPAYDFLHEHLAFYRAEEKRHNGPAPRHPAPKQQVI